jgi:hypothetical protein
MKATQTQFGQPGISIICVLALLLFNESASAAALRGRLVHANGNSAAGIVVTVVNQAHGRSAPVRTGADGMYYLQIPAGSYHLEVWINPTPGAQPVVYPIQVSEPYTDIPPIRVP